MGDRPEKSLSLSPRGGASLPRGRGAAAEGKSPTGGRDQVLSCFPQQAGCVWASRSGTRTCQCFQVGSDFFPPANVKLTGMLKGYNGGTFQWYFSAVQSFNGIFLKIGSFNGTELISPIC